MKSGNVYLEPIFYSLNDDEPGTQDPDDRCYVYAVQRGQTFHAESVIAIMQVCYRDGYSRPQSTTRISVRS